MSETTLIGNGGLSTTLAASTAKHTCHASCVHLKREPALSDDLFIHVHCSKGIGIVGDIGGGDYPKKVAPEEVSCAQYEGEDFEW